jgi:hypothetical protein
MAAPTLTPVQQTSIVALPSASSDAEAAATTFPFSVYTTDEYFLSGAADQVAYTFNKLGGDVLDIELTKEQVFSAYQEACLEYSYLLNLHQAKNSISDLMGATTGSFDEQGQIQTGDALSGSDVNLKFPKYMFSYARKVTEAYATEAGFGGTTPIYSASFDVKEGTQDYDLQAIVSASAHNSASMPYFDKVKGNRINISKVFYKTPQAMWRFYGYYGGLNVVGNLSSYGQFSDDSTWQLVPVWENKAQAMGFEDAIYTRNSHYSYEVKDNKIRIYPSITMVGPKKFWIQFYLDSKTPWAEDSTAETGIDGINNINGLPFENVPYQKINAIGKQWIRRFALSLCKEVLGNIRSKFATVPIPGQTVTLNGPALLTQASTEQKELREELKTIFDELTYAKVAALDAEIAESIGKIQEKIPNLIYTG